MRNLNHEVTQVVRLNKERLYGLKLRTIRHKPKTTMADFLDNLLEKAGIPKITEQEYKKEVQT